MRRQFALRKLLDHDMQIFLGKPGETTCPNYVRKLLIRRESPSLYCTDAKVSAGQHTQKSFDGRWELQHLSSCSLNRHFSARMQKKQILTEPLPDQISFLGVKLSGRRKKTYVFACFLPKSFVVFEMWSGLRPNVFLLFVIKVSLKPDLRTAFGVCYKIFAGNPLSR